MSFINMFYRTGASNINKELERAINERNCDEVKVLLSTGADINHTVNQNLDTMLHTTNITGIARDLLGYSANINAKNLYEKTPLHSAAENGKSPEFIQTLLEHGAKVDAKDSKGNTPLNYAVKRTDTNYEVIRDLIFHGADINARNNECRGFDNHCTPLDNAVLLDNLDCVKALIKYTLMTKLCVDVNAIDLRPYFRRCNYRTILRYLSDCSDELNRMKRDIVNDKTKTTLHQVVRQKFVCRDFLGKDDEAINVFTEKCLEIVKCNNYLIYNDVIMTKLKTKLEKKGLVNKLKTMQIYTEVEQQRKIALNSDSATALARYLPRNDLFNFVIAYYVPNRDIKKQRSIKNLVEIRKELNKRLCEPSTSTSCAKYFKFA